MIPFFPRFAPFGENVRDKDRAMARDKVAPSGEDGPESRGRMAKIGSRKVYPRAR